MSVILPCFPSRLSAPFMNDLPYLEAKKRHGRRWGTWNLFLLEKNIVCASPLGNWPYLQTKEKARKKNGMWHPVLEGLRLDRFESRYPLVNFSNMIANIPQTHQYSLSATAPFVSTLYISIRLHIFYPDNRLTKCVVQFPGCGVRLCLITYYSGERKTKFVLKRTHEFHWNC